jgi:hypothetical protein
MLWNKQKQLVQSCVLERVAMKTASTKLRNQSVELQVGAMQGQ